MTLILPSQGPLITPLPVAATGDAKIDKTDLTLTTSFVDSIELSFVMPTGWNTALIVARGSAAVEFTAGSGSFLDPRIEIGSSNGDFSAYLPGVLNVHYDASASHKAVVTGDVQVSLAIRKLGGSSTLISRSQELSYIAMRAS